MLVDVKEVGTDHWFTAGQAQFECAGVGHLVHDTENVMGGELLADEVGMIETICVTHHAVEVAAAGDFPLAEDGKPLGEMMEFIPSDHRQRQPLQWHESKVGLPGGSQNPDAVAPL